LTIIHIPDIILQHDQTTSAFVSVKAICQVVCLLSVWLFWHCLYDADTKYIELL